MKSSYGPLELVCHSFRGVIRSTFEFMHQRNWSVIPSCMIFFNWSASYYVSRGFFRSPFRALANGNARWVTRGSEDAYSVTLDGTLGQAINWTGSLFFRGLAMVMGACLVWTP